MANATKILIINDSSSPLVNLPATTFRDNIRSFLADYAETQDYTLELENNTTVSRLFLASEATRVRFPLFVIEEQISSHGSSSPNSLCDFCKCVASDEWNKPLTKDSLEVTSRHLLYGLIHCNGFGHLLCINRDAVSNYLSGDQVMDLWDRLCSALHTRKISLDDTSRKRSMDLRLLHGVAHGRPWFGKWDYTLSHGNFGVTKDQYTRAILILSSMELDKIVKDFSRTRKEIPPMKMIIGFYRESSQTPLITLSELLQFMLAFSSKAPVEDTSCSSPEPEDNGNESSTKYGSFDAMAAGEGCKWSGKRLSETAQAVLNAFKDRNSVVLTRQEICEAVSGSILDRALVNFLLKHIDQVPMGDQIIQRTTPGPRVIRFSLTKVIQEAYQWRSTTPGLDPYEDIRYLYRNLFLKYPDHSEVYSDASEIILNCKSFVKEWPLPSHQGQEAMITVSCQVMLNHEELLRDLTRKLTPGELVTVSRNATIRELKSAVQKALRDTYCVMDSFEVSEIRNKDLEKIDENSGLQSEGGEIKTEFLVTGFGLDTCTELRYEGGFDDWTVDCKCGAVDDDGERMVACDNCKVWHHTKCSIEDDEDVPSVFLCYRCC
ncbi:hypothetical protein Bca101_064237 [Brassica carinata]